MIKTIEENRSVFANPVDFSFNYFRMVNIGLNLMLTSYIFIYAKDLMQFSRIINIASLGFGNILNSKDLFLGVQGCLDRVIALYSAVRLVLARGLTYIWSTINLCCKYIKVKVNITPR